MIRFRSSSRWASSGIDGVLTDNMEVAASAMRSFQRPAVFQHKKVTAKNMCARAFVVVKSCGSHRAKAQHCAPSQRLVCFS
jgi:hypothetical protein